MVDAARPVGPDGCAACTAAVPAHARFCPSCGAPQPETETVDDLRKTVTCLFCDAVGSTALGEALDAEVLRGVLGRYFEVAASCVRRHGGRVEKFIGDAVVAVFGVPEVREDDALRAVRAAADLRAALADLDREVTQELGVRLQVRTGLETGPVVVGAARAGGSFATGDAMNTAARLQQAAPVGEVLLGAGTLELVRDAVEVEPVAPVVAKGKAAPVQAYRLVGVRDVARGRRRREGGELVGRAWERATLGDVVRRASQVRRAQLVTVLGAAGLGKTRLVTEVLGDLPPSADVLTAQCLPHGNGSSYRTVAQLVRSAAGLAGGEQPSEVRAALEAVLDLAGRAEAVDALLPLLTTGAPAAGAEEVAWAVRALVEQRVGAGPLVLLVDDLHWAEPSLLDLLEALLDDLQDQPVVLLCLARPELLEVRPGWGAGVVNATTTLLEPLTPEDTAQLVRSVLGPGVPEEVSEAVLRRSGGNPLFAEEVLLHLVELGTLRRDQDAWVLAAPLDDVQVPPTVDALLSARLDRLPQEERDLLARLAVVGRPVVLPEAAALLPQPRGVRELLEALVRRDLLVRTAGPGESAWGFRHVLIQEAAYRSLPKGVRADLHLHVADLLAGADATVPGVEAVVASHLERVVALRTELGARPPVVDALAGRAREALVRAATAASAVDDGRAATGLLQRALQLPGASPQDRRDLLHRLAGAQLDQGRVADARTTVAELTALVQAGDASELERSAVEVLRLDVATSSAAEVDPAVLSSAAARAADAARSAGDVPRLLRALNAAINAATTRGRWVEVDAFATELAQHAAPGVRRRAVVLRMNAAFWGSAPLEACWAALEEARRQAARTPRFEMALASTESALLAMGGRVEQARACVASLQERTAGADHVMLGAAAFYGTQALAACGDLDGAVVTAEAGIEATRASGSLVNAATLLGWQALLLLELGRDERAASRLAEAEQVTSPYDAVSLAMLRGGRALLAARAGDAEDAGRLVAGALTAIDGTDHLVQQADLRRWCAEVPARAGAPAEEQVLLDEARAAYRRKGMEGAARAVRPWSAQG